MFDMPNRAELKQQARELLQTAQVSPKGLTALYCGLTLVLNLLDYFAGSLIPGGAPEVLTTFVSIFTNLAGWILAAGFTLYCMGIRRHEVTEYGTLFDGFSFTGKLILLALVRYIFVFLWSMLFIIPGIIAAYRYRFAVYNLCEDPEMGVMDAINMSKAQTAGFKWQLFVLDLSFLGWQILCGLTLGILSIWIQPYRAQTDIGFFQQIKAIKGIGWRNTPPHDDTFRPNDPFGGTDNSWQ